jgi:Fur family ferric uptake transcriptional regulator
MSKSSEKLDPEAFLRVYREFLTTHKLKYTVQRKQIIMEFIKAGGHLSAEELFRLVKKKQSGVGLASVYRTLSSLVQAGLAVERRFLDRNSVYEIHEKDEHHDHLICLSCRKIFEFENETIESLQREVAKGMGFQLQDHKLELYGICQRTNCPNLK